jgi:hypothetical protein
MSTNRTLAVIATLASLVAASAFPSGAYASARHGNHIIPSGAYASVHRGNDVAQPAAQQDDFQLDGRGLGTRY